MSKEQKYVTKVEDLIALCHILDDYKEFIESLSKLLAKKNITTDIAQNLSRISHGEKLPLIARKEKKFYEEHKEVIDTINKYTDIASFIYSNFKWPGTFSEERGLNFFYDYITSNIEEIDNILAVLNRLKELGFRDITFAPSNKFTDEEYMLYSNTYRNFQVEYLDNIEVIPNYTNDEVRYKTTGSNYKITARSIDGNISKEQVSIILNSLIFDYKRLPSKIDKEAILDPIVFKKIVKRTSCVQLKNSVDLRVNVEDLKRQFSKSKETIQFLTEINSHKELIKLLNEINEKIERLNELSDEYDENISKENQELPLEFLNEEKKEYVLRRKLRKIDLD